MLIKAEAITAWNTRAEPIGNSEELPEWAVKKIQNRISKIERDINSIKRVGPSVDREIFGAMRAGLSWVLSLRRDDNR